VKSIFASAVAGFLATIPTEAAARGVFHSTASSCFVTWGRFCPVESLIGSILLTFVFAGIAWAIAAQRRYNADQRVRQAPYIAPTDPDELARQGILRARLSGAKTPREAIEIIMKRPLTENEWLKVAAVWERNWEALK
jgi:hypothetical protein